MADQQSILRKGERGRSVSAPWPHHPTHHSTHYTGPRTEKHALLAFHIVCYSTPMGVHHLPAHTLVPGRLQNCRCPSTALARLHAHRPGIERPQQEPLYTPVAAAHHFVQTGSNPELPPQGTRASFLTPHAGGRGGRAKSQTLGGISKLSQVSAVSVPKFNGCEVGE
eukprot:174995-Pelagomonas_calceolata.AAC.3